MVRLLLPLKKLIIIHRIKSTLVLLFFSGFSARLSVKAQFNISDFAVFIYLSGVKSTKFLSA
jgi:hypothetical protein